MTTYEYHFLKRYFRCTSRDRSRHSDPHTPAYAPIRLHKARGYWDHVPRWSPGRSLPYAGVQMRLELAALGFWPLVGLGSGCLTRRLGDYSPLQPPLGAFIRQVTAGGPSWDMILIPHGRMEAYGSVCGRMGVARSIVGPKRTPEIPFQIMVFTCRPSASTSPA